MAMIPRTLLIAPWFGPWPGWIGVFLLTCKYNPAIDWLLVGDHPLPAGLPPNVRARRMSFAGYREQCCAALGLQADWRHPYKLCDLKPAYGVIHREDLEGYALWGWTDLDLVYGGLAPFIARRAPGHGLVSFSGTHVSGEFCLLRNHPAVNHAFELIKDWRRLMSDSANHALDEIALAWVFAPPGMGHVMFPGNARAARGRIVEEAEADALQTAHPASFENSYTTPSGIGDWHDGTPRHPLIWHWRDGALSTRLHPGHRHPYLNLLHFKSSFYWQRTLEGYGLGGGAAAPLWDRPEGPVNDPLEALERRGFAVDRRGFSALPGAGGAA